MSRPRRRRGSRALPVEHAIEIEDAAERRRSGSPSIRRERTRCGERAMELRGAPRAPPRRAARPTLRPFSREPALAARRADRGSKREARAAAPARAERVLGAVECDAPVGAQRVEVEPCRAAPVARHGARHREAGGPPQAGPAGACRRTGLAANRPRSAGAPITTSVDRQARRRPSVIHACGGTPVRAGAGPARPPGRVPSASAATTAPAAAATGRLASAMSFGVLSVIVLAGLAGPLLGAGGASLVPVVVGRAARRARARPLGLRLAPPRAADDGVPRRDRLRDADVLRRDARAASRSPGCSADPPRRARDAASPRCWRSPRARGGRTGRARRPSRGSTPSCSASGSAAVSFPASTSSACSPTKRRSSSPPRSRSPTSRASWPCRSCSGPAQAGEALLGIVLVTVGALALFLATLRLLHGRALGAPASQAIEASASGRSTCGSRCSCSSPLLGRRAHRREHPDRGLRGRARRRRDRRARSGSRVR